MCQNRDASCGVPFGQTEEGSLTTFNSMPQKGSPPLPVPQRKAKQEWWHFEGAHTKLVQLHEPILQDELRVEGRAHEANPRNRLVLQHQHLRLACLWESTDDLFLRNTKRTPACLVLDLNQKETDHLGRSRNVRPELIHLGI